MLREWRDSYYARCISRWVDEGAFSSLMFVAVFFRYLLNRWTLNFMVRSQGIRSRYQLGRKTSIVFYGELNGSWVTGRLHRQRRSKELGTGHPDFPMWKSHSQPPFGCKKNTLQIMGFQLPITSTGELIPDLWSINSLIHDQTAVVTPNGSPKDSTLGRFLLFAQMDIRFSFLAMS